jgi:uncharacterized delta-60 repeat protein
MVQCLSHQILYLRSSVFSPVLRALIRTSSLLLLTLPGFLSAQQPGSLDLSFNPGTGANSEVLDMALQSDNRIIIGGFFTQYNGTPANHVARLNSDGSLDKSFEVGSGANNGVRAVTIQRDGKILIAGDFTKLNGAPLKGIARVNNDGTLDMGFDPGSGASYGLGNPSVSSVVLQQDGKILIGGQFASVAGRVTRNLARLKNNGSFDDSFQIGSGPNGEVRAIVVQTNGDILIGGAFTEVNGVSRKGITRLYGHTDSVPKLVSPIRNGDTFRLSVPTVAGKTYLLEFTDSLTEKNWIPLSETAGDGSLKTLLDADANREQRFYRVRVE